MQGPGGTMRRNDIESHVPGYGIGIFLVSVTIPIPDLLRADFSKRPGCVHPLREPAFEIAHPALLEHLLVLEERGVPFNFNECAGLAEQAWTGSIGETNLGSRTMSP